MIPLISSYSLQKENVLTCLGVRLLQRSLLRRFDRKISRNYRNLSRRSRKDIPTRMKRIGGTGVVVSWDRRPRLGRRRSARRWRVRSRYDHRIMHVVAKAIPLSERERMICTSYQAAQTRSSSSKMECNIFQAKARHVHTLHSR